MDKSTKKELEKIIGRMKCPKNFVCYKSGFKTLCRAEDVGMKSYLKCMEENPTDCVYSLGYAESHYCTCLLRFYIAKKVGK